MYTYYMHYTMGVVFIYIINIMVEFLWAVKTDKIERYVFMLNRLLSTQIYKMLLLEQ